MEISYDVKENEMTFFCQFKDLKISKDKTYFFREKIPSFTVDKGKTAIRKYAEMQARKHIKKRKEINRIGVFLGRSHFYPFLIKHNETTLKGIMFSDDGQYLEVYLIAPFKGKKEVRYNMFSAMSKKFIHGDIFGFSENAIGKAKSLLISIFQEEKNKEIKQKKIIELAGELNKK